MADFTIYLWFWDKVQIWKKFEAAGGLSGGPAIREPTAEEIAESEDCLGAVEHELDQVRLDKVSIKRVQQEYDILQTVMKWVLGDWPRTKEQLGGQSEVFHVYFELLRALQVDEVGG